MDSQSLWEKSQKYAPGGVHSPVRAFKSVGGSPVFFQSAQGAYLTSVEGKEYIDFCQSFGPNILGHRDPEVQAAVSEMVDRVWSLGTCEPYSLELAEWLVEQVPSIEKIRFVCSGTEAVMSALRVARASTGRSRVLKFEGCYHGHADAMLVKAGSGLAGAAASDSAGVSEQNASDTLVAPLDREDLVEKVFAEHGSEIAAVIVEPLPANFGLLIQRKEFWFKTFELAKKHGALIIFDEVISGFRVAQGGMAEVLDFQPDLVTYGKVIGGGFPVGAYAGKRELMDLVAPAGSVYQAGTLAANPIGMVAGLATLKKVQREGVREILATRTENMAQAFNAAMSKKGIPLRMHYFASLFWMHEGETVRSVSDFHPQHTEYYKKVFAELLQQSIYLAPSAFEVGFMSLAHSEELLEKVVAQLIGAVDQAYNG